MGIIGEEIKPDKKAIVYSKEGRTYTNLFDIATQKQNKKDSNLYRETESEVINGKRYYKTTYYEPVNEEPTVQEFRKTLGFDK